MAAIIPLTRGRIILLASVLVLVVAYTLFGFFGVPRLLHAQATEFVSKEYGRKLELGDIQFNPYTLVLQVHGLSFPDTEGQPLVGFRDLLVNFNASSLFRLAPSFADIELTEPFTGLIVRKDGTLNLVDLARPFSTPPEANPEPKPEEPLKLYVEHFRVVGGRVDFEDRSRATPFRTRLAPITFDLRDFATTGEAGNTYALRAASVDDERFAWSGSFRTTPFTSSGNFEIANLRATTLWSYLRDALPFELTSGMINLQGGYEFAARDSGLKLNVKDVTATDLALHAPNQQPDDVKVAKLSVTDTRFDLLQRRVDIGKLALSGAALRARRDAQGAINLLGMLGEDDATAAADAAAAATTHATAPVDGATPATGATTPEAASPWVVNVPDIAVEAATMDVEDGLVKPAAMFKLAPIDVKVSGFSTAPGTNVQVDAAIGIDGAAKVAAKGQVALDTPAQSLHLDVSNFNLASLQPYLGTYTQMTLSRGTLDAALDIKRNEKDALGLAGEVEVAKLHTVDNAMRQEFITWDRLKLTGIEYSSEPASLRIATVAANAPYARLIIAPDQTVNVSKVLSAPGGSHPAPIQTVDKGEGPRAAPPPAMRMNIGAVRIVNGAANFADFWIQPNYAVNLQNMNGSILGLSSDPKSRAKVEFEGKVDRYAPAKISGVLNLLSAALYTDIKVSFKGVEMTSVTPYSGRFAGYKIEKGKLSIDVAYLVENRTLTAKQRFVIDQLELGERVESADAVHLPLKLAVALLKDSNGVIDIDLPMTGSLDDPQFRMGPLIWKAFVGLLTKAATAPFKLLGSLFGGGEEMNLIEFDAGSAALDPAAQEKVASIIKALTARPGLQLEVPTTWSPALDGAALTSRRVEGLLRSLPKSDELALADPARRFELLVTQYQADYGAKTALPPAALALEAIKKSERSPDGFASANRELEAAIGQKHAVSDADFEQLGQSRARAIQEALLGAGTLDATRVFILGANPSAASDSKRVRVELSLK